jgi:tetratricopeptide (TPR) repeat protein
MRKRLGSWLIATVLMAAIPAYSGSLPESVGPQADAFVGPPQGPLAVLEPAAFVGPPRDPFVGPRLDAFHEAERLELRGSLRASAERFVEAAREPDAEAAPCWRASRSLWRYGEQRYLDGLGDHIGYFERAERWAEIGLERDPRCGECALWQYAAMGRLFEDRGFLWAGRNARKMARLIELGLELAPTHVDANGSTTLGNLHYAAASFYRILPEWFWLRLLIGVRGSAERAMEHARAALEIQPERVDYQVEYGATLICRGTREDEPRWTAMGVSVLQQASVAPRSLPSDALDQEYALELIEDPTQGCNFSRLGFIDVEGEGRRVAASMKSGDPAGPVDVPRNGFVSTP